MNFKELEREECKDTCLSHDENDGDFVRENEIHRVYKCFKCGEYYYLPR